MDNKALIKTLRELFYNENKIEKRYARIWLRKEKWLRLYNEESFRLHVQYDQPIEGWTTKIRELTFLLHAKVRDAYDRIYSINVHYFQEDQYRRKKKDILVYEDEKCIEENGN